MSNFLSHLHEDLRRARLTRRGASNNFSSTEPTHKAYPRMEQVALPHPIPLDISLADALTKRKSAIGDASTPLSLQDLGSLLGLALGQRPESAHRNYPSGGARFPIETYLLTVALEDGQPGVFHYRPDTHALERLWDLPADMDIEELILHGKPEGLAFSSLLIFTAVWERSAAKYGDFAYVLSLLEAGHMSQNILLVAAALDIAARPMGGFDDRKIAEILDLDEEQEQVVHVITLGSKSAHKDAREQVSVFYE